MAQAKVSLTKIVIVDDALYHGNGDVKKWADLLVGHFAEFARQAAPVRSGALVSGIGSSTRTIGRRQVEGIIESKAPHTMYVLRGTTGPITTNRYHADPSGAYRPVWGYAKHGGGFQRRPAFKGQRREEFHVGRRGYWMHIPAYDGFPAFFATEVSGQDAQNFLIDAWIRTARNHKAIRGPIPDYISHP